VEVRGDSRDRRDPTRAPRDAVIGSAIVPRADLRAPGVRIGEVLRTQAGLQVTEVGGVGAPTTVSVRGAPAAETLIYLGGIRLNDEVGGVVDLSRIPLWILRSVEIYRGHAPFDADRFAIGGALFFEPRCVRETGAGGGVTTGSYGARAAHAWAATGDERAGVLAGVQLEHAANDYRFTDSHGTLLAPSGVEQVALRNADVTTRDAWLLGNLRLGSARVDLLANAAAREQGAPTLALVPARAARASYGRALLGIRATLPLAETSTLELTTAASVADARFDDPLNELALGARAVDVRGGREQQRVAIDLRPDAHLRFRFAADASSERLERDEEARAALRARRLVARLAAAALVSPTDGVLIATHVAVACDAVGEASRDCGGLSPEGRVGIAWTSPIWESFLDVGRYRRAPTLGELFGLAPLVHGNPLLRPESGTVVDLGVRAHGRHAYGALVGFVRRSDDLVGLVRSAQGFVVPENIQAARVAGLELQAGAALLPWLTIDGTATWLDPRDVSPGRRTVNDLLAFQSRLVLAPRIAVELRPRGWVRRVRAEARWIYQSSRFADAAGLAVIPEQSSIDADLLAEAWEGRCTLRVRVADLLDARRVDVVGYPLPGRSFFASFEVQS
jgi:iron complex outermembrane receptor protein